MPAPALSCWRPRLLPLSRSDNTAILDIDFTSITTAAGRHEVDVIVLATGFLPNEVLLPMEIIGRDGVSIADTWAGQPAGYHGVTVPGFPNFFILNGPGTGLAQPWSWPPTASA